MAAAASTDTKAKATTPVPPTPAEGWEFDRATEATPVALPDAGEKKEGNTTARWAWDAPDTYNTAKTPIGGFIAALLVRTGFRTLLRSHYKLSASQPEPSPTPAEFPFPHPLSASMHFLRIVERGASEVRCTVQRTSKGNAVVLCGLWQRNDLRTLALVSYGNLTTRTADAWGWSPPHAPPPRILSVAPPSSFAHIKDVLDRPGGGPPWNWMRRGDVRPVDVNGATGAWSAWLRLHEPRPTHTDPWFLVMACDAMPGAPVFAHAHDRPAQAATTWVGTTVLDMYFHALPSPPRTLPASATAAQKEKEGGGQHRNADGSVDAGPSWLFVDMQTDRADRGVSEFHGTVSGPDGRVLASYRQLMSVLSLERWGDGVKKSSPVSASASASAAVSAAAAASPPKSKL